MGMDAMYYIGGFDAPSRHHKDVIEASKVLTTVSEHQMYIIDTYDEKWPVIDDGYCVVSSLARAYSDGSKDLRAAQLKTLRVMFPGRPIYLADDYVNREEVVKDISEIPSKRKNIGA